ncbi:4Fe-4S binding protein [Lysobacter sp. KIS68-7]|uniref:4Fe-4S dicluster domain-containing protein n=1 Tax=Lysobacter sp. KIS68-7 TaxID=2904252 RepID=UPI001E55280A|nr:4Fe-4S dicluster domain-containing protein [Lysobacter sp. KIS68-7]UHQ20064.1 4Fe-4S binding protein [Lysobacter sp. KIS68-7]
MSKAIDLALVEEAGAFYVSERKVYPRDVSGRFSRLRILAVFWLLGMFYAFPWLRWGGRQAVLFDLPARKFHVFGLTFWPQDFLFLALLLIVAGIGLFFFTAIAGRLWCGYACPQTVWTEVFLWIERRIEGDRSARMKLDAAPWSSRKLVRKGAKHIAWIVFALWTGFTFVGFFTPIRDLAARAYPFAWGGWETFWVLFYAFATWGNAGFLREQVCKYMCPYARFQGAMFDRDTLLIAYDPMRGEPRGPRRRGLKSALERARGLLPLAQAYDYVHRAAAHPSAANASLHARGTIQFEPGEVAPLPKFEPEQLGDCIDCTMCVQVCPTGIDIRNGLQYECIACGACVDACDEVMDKMGFPHGLIRYTTQHAVDGKKTRLARPRVFIYATLLLAVVAGFVFGVATRSPFTVEALRDRNTLYRTTAEGIENGYTLKIANKQETAQRFRVRIVSATPELVLRNAADIQVPAGEVASVPVTVAAPASVVGRKNLRFEVSAVGGERPATAHADSTFFGPVSP